LDGTIQVWEVNQGRLRWKQEGAHSYEGVTGVAAVGDRAISAGWDGFVKAWRLADGETLWQLKHEAPVQAMALSVSGALLALGFGDGSVALYTLAEGS
jgi:WD40 repeat protein